MSSESKAYLIFSANLSLYAVEASAVQEIFFLPELTPVVEAPLDIAGLLNLRGQILPVMDLALRLGYRSSDYSITDSVIIVENKGLRIGVIVNQVNEVQNFVPQQINGELSYGRDIRKNSNFISGIAMVDKDLVMLLNIDNLIQYVERNLSNTEELTDNQKTLIQDGIANKQIESDAFSLPPIGAEYRVFCPNATPEERAIFRERADNLRQGTDSDDFSGLMAVAVIGLNGEYFGLELSSVREFTDVHKITPIPCCPPQIIGNINLRGEILTLIDIRGVLNLPIMGASNVSKAMVINIDDIVAGVTVDEVLDVTYLHPSDITPLPTAVHSRNDEFLRGTARFGGKMMAILEMEKIMKQGALVVDEEV